MNLVITEELRKAVDADRREVVARYSYSPLHHLTSELATYGAGLIEAATYLQACNNLGHASEFRLEDLREKVQRIGRILAAYDAAKAAELQTISNADWRKLRDGGAQ